MPSFRVDSSSVEKFSKKLKDLNKSAFPVAVRGALNDCAFDMKTKTLLKSAKDSFIERQPNFFKANSSYEKAEGFSVNNMKASVGMIQSKLKDAKDNYAIKDLEEQETGGDIDKKSYIPMLAARKGGLRSMVRANARLKKIRNIRIASKAKGQNNRQKFIKTIYFIGKGGFVLKDFGSKQTLFRINGGLRNGRFKLMPLYSYDKGRSVHVKARHFAEKAGSLTHKKIEDFYIARAEVAFEKYLR